MVLTSTIKLGGAQDAPSQSADVITLGGGIGLGKMTVSDGKYDLSSKDLELSYGIDLSYQHVWSKSWGIGVNVARYDYAIDGAGNEKIALSYIGPAAVYSNTLSEKWRAHGMLGMGYASQNDVSLSEGGFGVYAHIGVDYKISNHWGVCLKIQDYTTVFSVNNCRGAVYYENLTYKL